MRNFFLLLYLIISFVNAEKISEHVVLSTQTQEYLLSIQNVHEDYISIQFSVFSPFQGIYDMNYKKFADRLSVLYDTLLISKKTLLKKLKPINDISEFELRFIDTLDTYVRLLGNTIVQLSYICMRLYHYSNASTYSVNEYSKDIEKWSTLCEEYKLYGKNINARLDVLTISAPRFN